MPGRKAKGGNDAGVRYETTGGEGGPTVKLKEGQLLR